MKVSSDDLPLTIEVTTELVTTGEQLIQDRACLACHKLGNQDGEIAPDLTHAGLLRDQQWVLVHFRNPRDLVAVQTAHLWDFLLGDGWS